MGTTRIFAASLTAAISCVILLGADVATLPSVQAASSALDWLKLLDDGKPDEALAATSPDMQKNTPKGIWEYHYSKFRVPLGSPISRDCKPRFQGKKAGPPGTPYAPYITLDCVGSYSNMVRATEQLCMVNWGEGWKVDCYAINGMDFTPIAVQARPSH